MAPFPVKDFPVDVLAGAYDEADGPFVARTPSRQYVVMSVDDYAQYETPMTDAQRRMVLDDYAALKRGETVDAFVALEEIRVQHGF